MCISCWNCASHGGGGSAAIKRAVLKAANLNEIKLFFSLCAHVVVHVVPLVVLQSLPGKCRPRHIIMCGVRNSEAVAVGVLLFPVWVPEVENVQLDALKAGTLPSTSGGWRTFPTALSCVNNLLPAAYQMHHWGMQCFNTNKPACKLTVGDHHPINRTVTVALSFIFGAGLHHMYSLCLALSAADIHLLVFEPDL